jgi:glycosyltransferase involved in cell wall biosynthesis
VVGDGPKRDELRALGRERGIDCTVSWLGQRSDTSILLQAMEVFALLDAWRAARTPCPRRWPRSSNRRNADRGITDLLDERRPALLVASDDIHALAMALDRLPCDVRLRVDLGSRVTTRAIEDFSLSESMRRLINLYPTLQNASL